MAFHIHSVTSRSDERATSDVLIAAAREHGSAVDLIVPSYAWGVQRKLQLARTTTLGVTVNTYEHYLGELWELYGDGRTLVTAQQRRLIVRPLLDSVGLLATDASSELVTMTSSFVSEAMVPGLHASAALTQAESTIMELVSLYERELELKGLVECAQVEGLLDVARLGTRTVIVEEPPRSCVHEWRFLAALGQHAPVDVFEQALPGGEPLADDEPRALRARLYTGRGGLQAGGSVIVGEARGAHADGFMLVRVVQELASRGVASEDVLIVMHDTCEASPRVFDALARAGIPFTAQLSVPLVRTGLGNALCELASFTRNSADEASYDDLSDVLVGPYCGLKRADARALQGRWRSLAGSTAAERMRDIREGYVSGQANRAIVQERLQPLAALLEADDETRVRMLFENAKRQGAGVDALLDDRAAAHAALDFMQEAARIGALWHVDDLANVGVVLERSYGSPEHAVRLVSSSACELLEAPWIVMTDLDAHHYPMARRPDVFDGLRRKLGIGVEDTTALEQRLLLANELEACGEGFALCRCLTDAEGDELCQSALVDEALMAYRSQEDDDAGLPAQAVPAALEPYAVRVSEAEEFMDGPAGMNPGTMTRGLLAREGSAELLSTRGTGEEREFSPTQLEDYYRCPYRWFSSRRVGYNELDRSFDDSARGTLFHDTMARFYPMFQQLGYQRVTPGNVEEAVACAQQAFQDQLVESQHHHPQKGLLLRTQADELDVQNLRRQLEEFVRRDATFLPGFTPTYFEVSLMLEYATVPVRGKVDRIDVDEQGRAVIVDYKLSKLNTGYGLHAKSGPDDMNRHVQTDIYARLVEKHFALQGSPLSVVGSVYRSYSTNMLRGVYDASVDFGPDEETHRSLDALPSKHLSESYVAYLERVERTIRADVERLAAGDIAPNPIDTSACEFCKAASFCPKKEGGHGAY